MHHTASFSTGSGSASSDSSISPGSELAYGDSYWYWSHAKLGWEFGFGLLPIHVAGAMSVMANRNIYGFDIITTPVPVPGYQGGFDASGENSFIGTTPISSTTGTIPGTTGANLDVMLYTVRLGP